MYIDKKNHIVNEYSNAYHRTIKMKAIDVKKSTYFDFKVENNDKHPKFKVYDHEWISKPKKSFGKVYTSNWCQKVFVNKNTVSYNICNGRT